MRDPVRRDRYNSPEAPIGPPSLSWPGAPIELVFEEEEEEE